MKRFIFPLLFMSLMICNGFAQNLLEEGFEGSSMPPAGWSVYENSTSPSWQGWKLSSAAAHTGMKSAFVNYASPSHSSYLITPQLSLTGHKILSFWYAINYVGYTEYTTLTVEVSTTGTNIYDFTPIDTAVFSNTTNFVNMVVDLSQYSGQNVYIAFHVEDAEGTGVFLDDILVYDMPSCFPPVDVAVDFVGINGATVTWTPDTDVNSYYVEYTNLSNSAATTVLDSVTGGTYVISGLTPTTDYSVRVRANCGGDALSDWSTAVLFETACEAVTVSLQQPWTEGFEGYGTAASVNEPLNSCWIPLLRSTANTPHVSCGWAQSAHSGVNSLEMRGNANEVNLLLLPEFTNNLNTLRLSYYGTTTASTVAGSGTVQLGYVTDVTDPASFVVLNTVTPKDSSLGRAFSVLYGPYDFLNVPSTAQRMAIRFISNTWSTSWYFDDLTVAVIPDCSEPTQLAASNVSPTSATISWVGRDNLQYDIVYWQVGTTDTVTLQNVAQLNGSFDLTNLTSNTTYQCYVRSVCQDGTQLNSATVVSFTTLNNSVQLPYYNSFGDDPASYEEINMFGVGCNQWAIGTAAGNPAGSLYISDDGGVSNHYYHINAYVNYYSHAYAVLNVTFPQDEYEYHLSFDYRLGGEPGWDMFYVFMASSDAVITEGSLPPGMQLIGSQANVPEWTHADILLHNVAGTTKQIIFYWISDNHYFNNPPVAVDNIALDYFTCAQPTNVYVTGTGSDNTTVHWTDNNSSSWTVYYRPAASHEPYDSVMVSENTSCALTSLFSSTTYDCYVVANCDDGESSNASAHVQFRTNCGTGIGFLPYTEDFENYVNIEGSDYVPCWTRMSSSPQHYAYVNRLDFETNCLDFHYTPSCFTMAVLPQLSSDIPMNTVAVEFDVRRETLSGGPLEVGVLTDPYNAGSFEVVDTVVLSAPGTWEHHVVYCDHYYGNGQYLAFRVNNNGNHYVIVDNLVVDHLPNCIPATNLAATDIEQTSATLTWAGSSFEYEVFLMGSDTTIYTVNDTFLLVTGLQPSSSYMFMVRSHCGSDTALMSNVVSFFTECGHISVTSGQPWTENFESYGGLPETALGFSPCWATPLVFNASNGVFPTVYNYEPAATSGTNVVEIKGYETMVVLPIFATIINNLRVSFWANTNSGYISAVGLMEIGVVNGTDPSTFIPVDTVIMTAFNMVGHDSPHSDLMGPYDLDGITPTPFSRIAIRYRSDNEYVSCYLDDFKVELIPDCPSPVKASITANNITDNTADISWTDNNPNHHSWTLYYKKSAAGDDSWISMNATFTSVTLNNLDENTEYSVYVVSNCNGQPGDDPTHTLHFSTTMTPVSLPYATDFSDPTEWKFNNGDLNNWWMIGSVDGNTNGLFVTTDGVNPGYNLYSSALVTAEKVITVGDNAGFLVEFDVRVGGESGSNSDYDFMKMFLASPMETFEAHNPDEGEPGWAYPDYSVHACDFAPYMSQATCATTNTFKYAMTGNNTVHISAIMANPNISPTSVATAKLVFVWRNDMMFGTQPAAIITNLSVSAISCPQPSNLSVDNVGAYSADVFWTAGQDETSWLFSYRTAGESTWTEFLLTVPAYHFDNLDPLTTYEVRVQADCGGETSSPVSTTFTTNNCDVADQCVYTIIMSDSWGDGWNGAYVNVVQNGMTVATATLSAGNSGSQALSLCPSDSVSFVWNSGGYDLECSFVLVGPDGVTQLYSSGAINASTGTSLFNFNASCVDPSTCSAPTNLEVSDITQNSAKIMWSSNETATSWMVQYRPSTTSTWLAAVPSASDSYTLTGLDPSTAYIVRVKSVCGTDGESDWSQNQVFITLGGSTEHPVVVTLSPTNITSTSATLNGEISNPNALDIISRGFEWKATVGGTYTPVTTSSNLMSYQLTGLNPNTAYTYRAFATTESGTTYGEAMSFSTTAVATCQAPSNLTQLGSTATTLTIIWTNYADATEWEVRYRTSGADWVSVHVQAVTYYTITDLTPSKTYEVQVRAICDLDNLSDWSMSAYFATGLNEYLTNAFNLHPNPANSYLDVSFNDNELQVTDIEVYDVYGKLVRTVPAEPLYESSTTRINISGLAAGMYFVRVNTEKGTATKPFVKE